MGGRGRGRGRGSAVSFNIEQLGFAKGDVLPGQVTQPPPLYPPLDNPPIPLVKDVEQEYLLVVRKDLNVRLSNSPFHLITTIQEKGIEQYSARFQQLSHKERDLPVLWNRMPAELKDKASFIKRKAMTTKKQKSKDELDPNQVLARLEEREKKEGDSKDDPSENKKKKKNDDDDDEFNENNNDEVDEEELDEEMDDGTDYNFQYFDNGEQYLDDDDNLDDEPVY